LFEGALECVRQGHILGGLKANREFAECLVGYDSAVPEDLRTLLFDPQTAGGLMASVSASDAEPLLNSLSNAGVPARLIGEVLANRKPMIEVVLSA
jgi:selenide,water dikinase